VTSLAERFYEPVKTGLSRAFDDDAFEDDDFDWSDLAIYGVRERGMHGGCVLASELRLSWQKADLLCDLLETVRRSAIADRSAIAPRRETGVARKGEGGGAGTAIAQTPPSTTVKTG
jgi:hypothetical protein